MLCWRVSNLYIRSFLLRPLAGLCICTHRIDMCGGGIKTSGTKMAPPSNCAANTAGAPKKLRVLSPYLQTTLHIQCLSSEDTKIALWQPTVQQAEDSPSGSCTTSKWTGRGRTTCQRNWNLWKKQSHLRSYKFWTTLLAFTFAIWFPFLPVLLEDLLDDEDGNEEWCFPFLTVFGDHSPKTKVVAWE